VAATADAARREPAADGPWGPGLRRTTLGVVALVSLVAFEAMAVATAMPVAARELDGFSLYAWAFTGFLAASLFSTAVAGEVADRYGPRVPVVGGVGLFAVGLTLAGLAPAMVPFVLGRLVQGLGGGAIIVGVYVLVGQCYHDQLRPRMFSYLSAAWVLPAVVGPLVAGAVAETLSWRLVFYGLLPLVVAPVLLLLPKLGAVTATPTLTPNGASAPARRGGGRVWLALELAVGVAAVQLGGQQLEQGAVWLAAAGVLIGATLAVPAATRLMPAGTLRLRRGLPSVVALRGVQAGAFFGVEAFLPLMLVEHRDISPTLAGVCLTGAALGWSAGSWWQGRPGLSADRGRLCVVGALLALAGFALTSTAVLTDPAVPVLVSAIGWTLAGSGMGVAFSTLSVLLFRLSPSREQGANSAALQMSDALGCVLTVGLGGVLYAVLRGRTGDPAGFEFAVVFAVMLAVQVLGVVVARRVLPVAEVAPIPAGT